MNINGCIHPITITQAVTIVLVGTTHAALKKFSLTITMLQRPTSCFLRKSRIHLRVYLGEPYLLTRSIGFSAYRQRRVNETSKTCSLLKFHARQRELLHAIAGYCSAPHRLKASQNGGLKRQTTLSAETRFIRSPWMAFLLFAVFNHFPAIYLYLTDTPFTLW